MKKELEIKKEIEEIKHQHKMDELKYFRESEKLKHLWSLERQRISIAEQRKMEAEKF